MATTQTRIIVYNQNTATCVISGYYHKKARVCTVTTITRVGTFYVVRDRYNDSANDTIDVFKRYFE